MLKSLLLTIVFLTLTFGFFPNSASAHILKTDGSVGALLHIDPDDSPIVGQSTYFYFDFKDTLGKVAPENCACQVKVVEKGQTLTEQKLTIGNDSSASFSFTFPKKDVYSLQLTGQPLTNGLFQPFKLSYDIRVDRGGGDSFTLPLHFAYYLGIGITLFALVIFFILGTIRKRKLQKS